MSQDTPSKSDQYAKTVEALTTNTVHFAFLAASVITAGSIAAPILTAPAITWGAGIGGLQINIAAAKAVGYILGTGLLTKAFVEPCIPTIQKLFPSAEFSFYSPNSIFGTNPFGLDVDILSNLFKIPATVVGKVAGGVTKLGIESLAFIKPLYSHDISVDFTKDSSATSIIDWHTNSTPVHDEIIDASLIGNLSLPTKGDLSE